MSKLVLLVIQFFPASPGYERNMGAEPLSAAEFSKLEKNKEVKDVE